MTIYIESLYIGLIAWVYSVKLTEANMIFNGLYVWAYEKLPAWLFNPLIGCVYCVSGQMALWYYLVKFWNEYDFIDHVLFISVTIFAVEVISRIFNFLSHD